MQYTLVQIFWFFYIYSVAGWIMEVCTAAFKRHKFVNRGFVNGPFCTIYGFCSMLFAVFLPELTQTPFFLFLGGAILSAFTEYITGLTFYRIFHQKLWDYSDHKRNLGGYICLRYTFLWGVFAVLAMEFINPLLSAALNLIPETVSIILLCVLSGLLFVDLLGSILTVLGMQQQARRISQVSESLRKTSSALENGLTARIQSRMMRSFPTLDMKTLAAGQDKMQQQKQGEKIFASGCGFYKLFWLFLLGGVLGDLLETVFCFMVSGRITSRTSLIYAPFSVVWGLGCAILGALLYRYRDRSDRYIFVAGTVLGGAYEYICSIVTEIMFGTIYWDYSDLPFNLGGRINLLYCLFWGMCAVVFLKIIYPFFSDLIEKIPYRTGVILSNILIVFMLFNMGISVLAISRYSERNTDAAVLYAATLEAEKDDALTSDDDAGTDNAQDIVAKREEDDTSSLINALNTFLDNHFDDERMARIYPLTEIVVDGIPIMITDIP